MPNTPTLSVTGAVRIDSPNLESEEVLSAALEGITAHNPHVIDLAPGELNRVVTPSPSPATYMLINTNRNIRYRVNGGTENFTINRLRLDVATSITQIELFNDQLTTPEQVRVTVTFASGGTLV